MLFRRMVVILAAAGSVAAAGGPAAAGVRKGDRAREFVRVVDSAGKPVSLKPLHSKVVVLTFGASWCQPCRKELPALERLAERYSKARAGVVFMAVNIDNQKAKGKQFMDRAGLHAVRETFDTAKSTVEAYDPPKMPSIFVIKHGVVRYIHAGFTPGDEKKLAQVIDKQLK